MCKEKTKAVIDIETGGFSKEKNGICEIGMILIDSKNVEIVRYSSLIKPYRRPDSNEFVSYHPAAEEVHGISVETLEDHGKEAEEVCKEIAEILFKYDCMTFIGHNIHTFDGPRLNGFFQRFGGFEPGVFDNSHDTMKMAKENTNCHSFSLPALCEFFEITNSNEHRAIGDCEATLELYKQLLK